MLFAHDIFTLTVLLIVLLCVCLKGRGKKNTPSSKKPEKDFYMWLAEGVDRRNHDKTHSNKRWVEEHFKE
ncbi:MAG: hypothetical protein K6B13_13750 [Prevotella sp.]|nr:hypothetical protein [Prevotella sp.]